MASLPPRPKIVPAWPELLSAQLYLAMLPRVRFMRERVERRLIAPRADARTPVTVAGITIDLEKVLAEVLAETEAQHPVREIEVAASRLADKVQAMQRVQLQAVLRGVLGLEAGLQPVEGERWLERMLSKFSRENAQLVGDLTREASRDLAALIRETVASGAGPQDIAKAIAKQFDMTDRRAMFIARDQMGKLYGEMDRERQVRLGIQQYRWHTRLDERVRPSHRSLEATVHFWDRPPQNERGEHIIPGSDYNCRCWAEPLLGVGAKRRAA